MNIVQLPIEMLREIFSFLPTYKEVSLVNKLFYDIACSVNDSNTQLRINHKFVDRFLSCDSMGCQWLREIQSSKRQIPSVVIEGDKNNDLRHRPIFIGDQLSSVVILVEKFSPYIKFLKLSDVTMDVSTFLGILSMVPNLESLKLSAVDCPCGYQSSHKRRKLDSHGDLDLKRLKKLSIWRIDDKFLDVFKHLPIGVLTELKISDLPIGVPSERKISHFLWESLMAVVSRQWNIKNLDFRYVKGGSDDEFETETLDDQALDNFNKLTLESLCVHFYKMSSVSLATVLSKQRNLKYLTIHCKAVDDTVMEAIGDLAELEVLAMTFDIKKIEPETLRKIKKLKKLKDFRLQCGDAFTLETIGDSTVTLKTIADSVTASIKSLTMTGNLEISVDGIRALARSLPNLTCLKVFPFTQLEVEELHWFLTYFNFVEVFFFDICRASADELGDYSNPKLQELTFFGDGKHIKPWMSKFMAAYPNIKKLTMNINFGSNDFNLVKIAPILKAFTKLEWMKVSGEDLSVADLDFLLDGKHNLRYLQMSCMEKRKIHEVIKKLRTHFEVAEIEEHGCLHLAVDRQTMRRERKIYW